MNGIEFIQTYKSSINSSTPCFLLSGCYETHEMKQAIKENLIVKYFPKPMVKNDILESLEEYLVTV